MKYGTKSAHRRAFVLIAALALPLSGCMELYQASQWVRCDGDMGTYTTCREKPP